MNRDTERQAREELSAMLDKLVETDWKEFKVAALQGFDRIGMAFDANMPAHVTKALTSTFLQVTLAISMMVRQINDWNRYRNSTPAEVSKAMDGLIFGGNNEKAN